jgi:hypothetical protein
MLGLDIVSFPHSKFLLFFCLFLFLTLKKKIGGEDRIFISSFDSFLDIVCILA